MRKLCKICKTNLVAGLGKNNGFRSVCDGCYKKPYTRNKKTYCENCLFVALHRVQLDIDHIDGNHKNNFPENLRTICANCHRLKTHNDRNLK